MARATRRAAVALLALLLMTGAACSSGGNDDDGGGGGGGDATTPAAPADEAVTIQQEDFAFVPGDLTVASGGTINVENITEATPHTFTVEGEGIDAEVFGGESETVTVDLEPGDYPFICRFHKGSGMEGTLTVT